MTTREENLKKLNEELEKLSDEELEEIAGGARKVIEEFKPKDAVTDIAQDAPNSGKWRILHS